MTTTHNHYFYEGPGSRSDVQYRRSTYPTTSYTSEGPRPSIVHPHGALRSSAPSPKDNDAPLVLWKTALGLTIKLFLDGLLIGITLTVAGVLDTLVLLTDNGIFPPWTSVFQPVSMLAWVIAIVVAAARGFAFLDTFVKLVQVAWWMGSASKW